MEDFVIVAVSVKGLLRDKISRQFERMCTINMNSEQAISAKKKSLAQKVRQKSDISERRTKG